MNISAYIAQIEYYLPENVLTNEDLAKEYVDWPAIRIKEKTGIETRHIAGDEEHVSMLAEKAAQKLISSKEGIVVDYLILCTQCPDYLLPTTACLVQNKLRLPTKCGAIDINQGCSGFVYSLGLAKGLIETRQADGVLLINADTYTKYISAADKSVRTLFGDAAAATYVGKANADTYCIRNFVYGTDGSGANNLICNNSALKKNAEIPNRCLYMNGPEIFNFTLEEIPKACRRICEMEGCEINDFEHVVFHQANKFILDALRKKLRIDESKFPIMMEDTGNTVSASIPIVLKKMIKQKKLKTGDRLLLLGFGVGYSWAGCVVEWR